MAARRKTDTAKQNKKLTIVENERQSATHRLYSFLPLHFPRLKERRRRKRTLHLPPPHPFLNHKFDGRFGLIDSDMHFLLQFSLPL